MSEDDLFDIGYETDNFSNEIIATLRSGQLRHKKVSLFEYREKGGRLYFRDKL